MRDKRRYQRADLEAAVTVTATDGSEWSLESRDISLGGIFLTGVSPVPIGSKVDLQFELPKLGPLKVPAFVRWTNQRGFGLQFGLLGVRETHAIGAFVRSGREAQPAQ